MSQVFPSASSAQWATSAPGLQRKWAVCHSVNMLPQYLILMFWVAVLVSVISALTAASLSSQSESLMMCSPAKNMRSRLSWNTDRGTVLSKSPHIAGMNDPSGWWDKWDYTWVKWLVFCLLTNLTLKLFKLVWVNVALIFYGYLIKTSFMRYYKLQAQRDSLWHLRQAGCIKWCRIAWKNPVWCHITNIG